MQSFQAELLYLPASEELRFLPECPRLLREQANPILAWVAIQHDAQATQGSLNLLNLATLENENHPLAGRPGFFAETDEPGVLLIGMERGLSLYDFRNRTLTETGVSVSDNSQVIINDGMAIDGGLLFGTKHVTFTEKAASIYWFDGPAGRLHEMRGGQICSNGKHLYQESDTQYLIDIDSFTKTLVRYEADFVKPQLHDRDIVADFRDTPLYPDGLRPTPDGRSVVVAFYNPEAVSDGLARQFRVADGAVEAEWRLPGSPRVTCPEFVRLDGRIKILFTTAVEGMPEEIRRIAPSAGGIFLADTSLQELPPPPPLFPAAWLRNRSR